MLRRRWLRAGIASAYALRHAWRNACHELTAMPATSRNAITAAVANSVMCITAKAIMRYRALGARPVTVRLRDSAERPSRTRWPSRIAGRSFSSAFITIPSGTPLTYSITKSGRPAWPTPGMVDQYFNDSTDQGDAGQDFRGPWNSGRKLGSTSSHPHSANCATRPGPGEGQASRGHCSVSAPQRPTPALATGRRSGGDGVSSTVVCLWGLPRNASRGCRTPCVGRWLRVPPVFSGLGTEHRSVRPHGRRGNPGPFPNSVDVPLAARPAMSTQCGSA